MKRTAYSNAALKAILLKDKYPNGEAAYLMGATTLVLSALCDNVVICTKLPDEHWAFTCQEEPKPRYVVATEDTKVIDSISSLVVGIFFNRGDARDYARFLNDRLKA